MSAHGWDFDSPPSAERGIVELVGIATDNDGGPGPEQSLEQLGVLRLAGHLESIVAVPRATEVRRIDVEADRLERPVGRDYLESWAAFETNLVQALGRGGHALDVGLEVAGHRRMCAGWVDVVAPAGLTQRSGAALADLYPDAACPLQLIES